MIFKLLWLEMVLKYSIFVIKYLNGWMYNNNVKVKFKNINLV